MFASFWADADDKMAAYLTYLRLAYSACVMNHLFPSFYFPTNYFWSFQKCFRVGFWTFSTADFKMQSEMGHKFVSLMGHIWPGLRSSVPPLFSVSQDATTNNKGSRVKFSHNQQGPYVLLKLKLNVTENVVVNI